MSLAVAVLLVLAMVGCGQASKPAEVSKTTEPSKMVEEPPVTVRFGTLSFPALSSTLISIVKVQGLDAKNGIKLEVKPYAQVAAYYAALASGEIDALAGGPLVYQKMRTESVPLRIISTYIGLEALTLISGDPSVNSLADLKGKQVAADIGSADFQFLAAAARSKGIELLKDASVVQANQAAARTQLKAGRVVAAMVGEPTTTLTMSDSAGYKIIWSGKEGWKEVTGVDGWGLVVAAREDFLSKNPRGVDRLIKALQDAAAFLKANPDEADKILAKEMQLPPGTIKTAVQAGRLTYDVRPAWNAAEKESLWVMFRSATLTGYLSKLPDEGIIHKP